MSVAAMGDLSEAQIDLLNQYRAGEIDEAACKAGWAAAYVEAFGDATTPMEAARLAAEAISRLTTFVDQFLANVGLKTKGVLDDPADLPTEGNAIGDGYLIGGDLWVWVGVGGWMNAGPIVGPPGPSVELRVDDDYIQWRVEGDDAWTNLVALSVLIGPDGPAIEMRATVTHIQWRVVGDETWIDLIALSLLTGPAGPAAWTPVLAMVADSARRVWRIVDWTGGGGTKPATGKYIGPSGLVDTPADATDVRGAAGAGTGDIVGPGASADGEMMLWNGTSGTAAKRGPVLGSLDDLAAIVGAGDALGLDWADGMAFRRPGYRWGGVDRAALLDVPGVTFSRSTAGWAWDAAGKIQEFDVNEPRRTDLGLYVGAQAVGLFTRWDPTAAQIATKGNCADTTEPADAPLAGRNWITLDNTAGTAYAYVSTSSIPASTEVTVSILVETQDGSQPVVGATDSGAYDFSLRGHNGNYLSSLSARYTRRSGNVWDATVTGTTPGTGTSVFLGIARATTNNARPLKFSGFTAVAGPVASPPIIATGTALTVAPEVLSQALALPAAQDFTLAMRVVLGANPVSPFSQAILEWDDGSPSNRFLVHRQGNGAVEFLAVMAGVTSNRPSIAKSGPRDLSVVLRRSAGALQLAVDHGLLPTSVDVAGMPDLTQLWLGRRREGGSNVNGLIQRSLYLPRAVSDAEMEAL